MQPLYLLKIDEVSNNNKFYKMIPNGSTFEVQYGRVGNSYQTDTYPISKWDAQLKSKLKKGYVDQTHLVQELSQKVKSKEYCDITNTVIAKIVERLQRMAKIAIEENYTISSQQVTKKMIEEAQVILNNLSSSKDIENFNKYLLELFRTIPRKMKRVSENLSVTKNDFSSIVQREQDLLDVMKSQVVQNVTLVNDIESNDTKQTILQALGLEFYEVTEDEKREIKKQLGSSAYRFHQAWKVINTKTQKVFDGFVNKENIKHKKLLFHGSRSENFWSIINNGLLLRPNAIITGKMFGNGLYLSNDADKSLGYTSLGGLGSNNSIVSGTSLVITTTATLEAGNVGVLAIGKDNACTVDGETSEISAVVDSASNTWNKIKEYCNTDGGAANDSATAALWVTVAANQSASGGTITITMGTTTSKSAVANEFSMGANCEGDDGGGAQVTGVDGATDPPSMTISGLVNEGHLFVRTMAFEARDDDITVTTNYTESAVAIANAGSAGASITTEFEFRALTATGDTSDPSKTTDSSNANAYVALK